MKIYIVFHSFYSFREKLSNVRLLESYYYIKGRTRQGKYRPLIDWFLDSGAFSAFSQKTKINIDQYADFIHKHKADLNVYANLDSIGDPQQTQKNQDYLEAQGLNPLPVFHYGENIKILEGLIEKYDYIALGGMVPIPSKTLIHWLDFVWEYLCDEEGRPKIKVHGFGMTTRHLIKRYPWFSIDSTSPIIGAAMGRIYTENGECDLSRKQGIIPEATKIFIKQEFPQFTLEELANDYRPRTIYNIEFMQKLEKELTQNPPRFINRQARLF